MYVLRRDLNLCTSVVCTSNAYGRFRPCTELNVIQNVLYSTLNDLACQLSIVRDAEIMRQKQQSASPKK